MPRSPTVYSLPPGTTPQAPNTVIGSAMFNAAMDDIASTFNTAQPLAYGGTGGTSQISGWDGLTAKGTDIASAGTINLTTATGPRVDITGTTTITAVTLAAGTMRLARATGIFQITAGASLVVNKSASVNYTTAVGDLLLFQADGAVISVTVVGGGGGTFATPAQALAGTSATLLVNPQGLYLPTGHLTGMTLSNNVADATNDIDIAAGKCRDSTDLANIYGTAMTKRLDANWAAGTGNGGRNSGVAITDTTYHVYAVSKALGADPDYYFHTSTTVATVITALQAETGGASYIYARRIGSIMRAGSTIRPFMQDGDDFYHITPIIDVDVSNPGTSAVTRTLSVPVGLLVTANFRYGGMAASTNHSILVTSLFQTDSVPTAGTTSSLAGTNGMDLNTSFTGIIPWVWGNKRLPTNTSAQIRTRHSASGASDRFALVTEGWADKRGRV